MLSTHYNKANERFGYEVVAAMNGSFFSMANGYLNSMFISNGRVSCAHAGLSDNLVVFMPDGTIETVKSCLSYRLMIDGVEVPAGLGQINKYNDSGKWNDKFYYFDVSCGTKSDSAQCDVNGTELICKKLAGTDLVVGGTMLAEVVEVKKDSKGNNLLLIIPASISPSLSRTAPLSRNMPISKQVLPSKSLFPKLLRNHAK